MKLCFISMVHIGQNSEPMSIKDTSNINRRFFIDSFYFPTCLQLREHFVDLQAEQKTTVIIRTAMKRYLCTNNSVRTAPK